MIILVRTAFVCLLLLVPAAVFSAASARSSLLRNETVTVLDVIDGDTLIVRDGARRFTVRLIGVDTPEIDRPDTLVQFYGPEASDFTRRSLEGKEVRLLFEPPNRPGGSIDKYGRTLAYVFTDDATNFDLELVRLGYGKIYAKYPFTFQREFEQAEHAARAARRGIWNREKHALWSDPARRGAIIGNLRSRRYHMPGQQYYDATLEKNRVYFQTEDEARQAGFLKARN